MSRPSGPNTVLGCAVAIALAAVFGVIARAQMPLAIDSARITISGTSNIHAYTASATTVRVTRSQVASAFAGPEFWSEVLRPGAIEAFEVAIPAATETGLAAKEPVCQTVPEAISSMSSREAAIAPSGKPPPIAFAKQVMSGFTPEYSGPPP